jgi:hypothetical protein
VRKDESYGHESEVRLLFWPALSEPPQIPGAWTDCKGLINAERVASDVLKALAEFFPHIDFSSVDGKYLVARAVQHRQWQRLEQEKPKGKSIKLEGLRWIDRIVVGPRVQPWVLELVRDVVKPEGLDVRLLGLLSKRRRPE